MFERLSPETMLRLRPIMFLGVFGFALLPFFGMQFADKPNQYNLWAWWGIFIYWVVAPIIEHMLGKDSANPTSRQINSLEKNLYYELLVIMIIPAQLTLLLYGAHFFSSTNAFNLFGRIGWILSNGLCSTTLAFVAAHELIHKPGRTAQIMGSILLASVCNTGFKIEHLRGHHLYTGTQLDVYSAPLHQSLYDYILKTCYHNLVNPWKLETKRLNRQGHSFWSWRNEQIIGYAASATLAAMFYSFFGVLGLIFFCAQSMVALIVLQIINYIQHYGLARRERDPGKFERPTAAHAWNSNFWLTNIVLLHLPRHSDHHIHPGRGYQVLRHLDESPQMPTGYAGMFIIALIPTLWFKVMNPRVSAYHPTRGHEITKANFN
jgi:alkane 1-monooxygenase